MLTNPLDRLRTTEAAMSKREHEKRGKIAFKNNFKRFPYLFPRISRHLNAGAYKSVPNTGRAIGRAVHLHGLKNYENVLCRLVYLTTDIDAATFISFDDDQSLFFLENQ